MMRAKFFALALALYAFDHAVTVARAQNRVQRHFLDEKLRTSILKTKPLDSGFIGSIYDCDVYCKEIGQAWRADPAKFQDGVKAFASRPRAKSISFIAARSPLLIDLAKGQNWNLSPKDADGFANASGSLGSVANEGPDSNANNVASTSGEEAANVGLAKGGEDDANSKKLDQEVGADGETIKITKKRAAAPKQVTEEVLESAPPSEFKMLFGIGGGSGKRTLVANTSTQTEVTSDGHFQLEAWTRIFFPAINTLFGGNLIPIANIGFEKTFSEKPPVNLFERKSSQSAIYLDLGLAWQPIQTLPAQVAAALSARKTQFSTNQESPLGFSSTRTEYGALLGIDSRWASLSWKIYPKGSAKDSIQSRGTSVLATSQMWDLFVPIVSLRFLRMPFLNLGFRYTLLNTTEQGYGSPSNVILDENPIHNFRQQAFYAEIYVGRF